MSKGNSAPVKHCYVSAQNFLGLVKKTVYDAEVKSMLKMSMALLSINLKLHDIKRCQTELQVHCIALEVLLPSTHEPVRLLVLSHGMFIGLIKGTSGTLLFECIVHVSKV